MIIFILGPSNSGKTTLADKIVSELKYKKIITYTTRDKRHKEIDGADYHFVDDKWFNKHKNKFLEYTEYNNCNYGSLIKDYRDNRVVVTTPSAIEEYNKAIDYGIIEYNGSVVIYLNTSEKERIARAIVRHDDLEVFKKRLIEDKETFKEYIEKSGNDKFLIELEPLNLSDDNSKLMNKLTELAMECTNDIYSSY